MARIRSLKPDFFTSEQIVSVSIPARMLFQGLWVFGDDDGYISASLIQLKMKVFPADVIEVKPLLDELLDAGLVVAVETDQGPALHVPSFLNHQSPKYPTPSKFTVDGAPVTQHSPRIPPHVGKASGSVPPGEERRGEERSKKEPAKRGTRIHSDFAITDEMREWARKETPLVNVDAKLSAFIDYWAGVPGEKGVKLDWLATWRNSMRKQQEFAERDNPKSAPSGISIAELRANRERVMRGA